MTPTEDTKDDGRTRNGRATRERIFEAAVAVFVARGYDSATMNEIAVRAGAARRTAFNHFPTKADIAAEWAVRRGQMAFALAREAEPAGRSAAERVGAYFHELALMTERDWEETRQMTTGWLRGYGAPQHRSWLAGEVREWLRGWVLEQPGEGFADTSLATDVLFDVFQGTLLRWLPRPAPAHGEFAAEADAAVALVLAGFAGRAGDAPFLRHGRPAS